MTAVQYLQQTMTRGSCQDFTVLTQQETGHITGNDIAVNILDLHIAERHTVIGLQCSIQSQIK